MRHLLGECPLGLKGQQPIFEEDALPVAGLDGEAAITQLSTASTDTEVDELVAIAAGIEVRINAFAIGVGDVCGLQCPGRHPGTSVTWPGRAGTAGRE